MWTHRTLIVEANHVELARSLCAAIAGPGGSGMFTAALSQSGQGAPTHFISAGFIEAPFADLLPLTSVTYGEDGTPSTSTRPGNVALTAQLAAEAGLPISEAEVAALLTGADVSEQKAEEALSRLDLQIVAVATVLQGAPA